MGDAGYHSVTFLLTNAITSGGLAITAPGGISAVTWKNVTANPKALVVEDSLIFAHA